MLMQFSTLSRDMKFGSIKKIFSVFMNNISHWQKHFLLRFSMQIKALIHDKYNSTCDILESMKAQSALVPLSVLA